MQKKVEAVIKDISLRHNVPYEVAKTVVFSQFRKLKEALTEGEHDKPETFNTVNLKYIGKFYATRRKIERIKQMKKENGDTG